MKTHLERVPLSTKDRKFLKRNFMLSIYILVGLFTTIGIIMWAMFGNPIPAIVIGTVEIIVILLLLNINKTALNDVKNGFKIVSKTPIQNKVVKIGHHVAAYNIQKNKKTINIKVPKTKVLRRTGIPFYFMVINNIEFLVSEWDFYHLEIGDNVKCEYSEQTKTLLSLEHLNKKPKEEEKLNRNIIFED